MFIASGWKDFEVLDTGNGEKLERWGNYLLARPDPQVIWPCANEKLWQKADAHYSRSERGGGSWDFRNKLPEKWVITYQDLKFYVRPTGFKHTGLFPDGVKVPGNGIQIYFRICMVEVHTINSKRDLCYCTTEWKKSK